MSEFAKLDLYQWCKIPAAELPTHAQRKVPFRIVPDSRALGKLMAEELCEVIETNNRKQVPTRAIIPCGPKCWYEPFTNLVNQRALTLKHLFVFHMDECLDWQARPLPHNHPYNFRTFMEQHFYGGIRPELAVPEQQRFWLLPSTADDVRKAIDAGPIDITVGGWGQDGHVAYNQARRHPYNTISLEDLAASTIRIQDNNSRAGTALVWGRVSVRASHVDYPRTARVPFRKQSPRIQRYGIVETNCIARRVVCQPDS
jgi:glucosamine-6-phosphate deaminase